MVYKHTYVRKQYPLALYSHCVSHSFDLAVNDACDLPEIRNCIGTIKRIYDIFNTLKRQAALKNAIRENPNLNAGKNTKLKNLCATRWVQRHEAAEHYLDLQPAVFDALQTISETWNDVDASSKAFSLLLTIKT